MAGNPLKLTQSSRLLQLVRAIAYLQQLGTYEVIKIHAQSHLEKFYTNLGFQTQGESSIEAGIEHLVMLRQV